MSPSFSKFWFVVLGMAVLFSACTSEQQKGAGNSTTSEINLEDNLPHDPYSAQLNAATSLAQAEDFTTTLLNGESFTLSQKQGKVVVLNIWATWCPPCEKETPDLVDMYEKYKDQGLIILGISIDKQGKSVVVPFVEKYDVTYPITIDDGTIMDKYGPTMGVPTTYIVGNKGNLRYFAVGAISKKELEPRLKKLLDEPSGSS